MIAHKLYNMVMVHTEDHVLLLNRQHDDFSGFIPPGGKVDFPESLTSSAIREVKEETGLDVRDLEYKGIQHYVNKKQNVRYLIFYYITSSFSGHLLTESREGKPSWFKKSEVMELPMQDVVRTAFPLFFQEGTFELYLQAGFKESDDKEDVLYT
ncbi:8-oxo-dGTP diphosphatase [Terribacillus aidingensis]|uniref:8-oxo-dGTP diphosphatase n=1 Tax=Terribacillus aidingensis TaxID=586416 RepID=A0A285MYV3_9BACI|nr:8-oxo-dGTP diphosphatase [Terribacillus aidingensis]SNZ02390.1 8-oxo-dGTP diphosphatase [Terribacillus aidingensis]